MTKRPTILYLLIYVTLTMLFAFYWANNYPKYGTYKGDHFESCLLVVLLLTYVLFVILQTTVRKINWILVVLLPVIFTIATIALGILVMFGLGLSGTPEHTIYIYVITHLIIATSTTLYLWDKVTIN